MENRQKLNTIENGSEPLVSVIMPVYNTEYYLGEAVDSILSQSMSDFELIIIEDCSTDSTRSIVDEYASKDSRIVTIYNESNLGLVASLNKAIDIARGRYIARMDGDDVSKFNRFEKQIRFLEDSGLDIVGCQCVLFTDDVNVGKDLDYPTSDNICRRFLRHSNALAHPAWLGKREVFASLGYRNIAATEDYDFMIRATMAGYKIGNAPERCFCYRINGNGISVSNSVVQNVTARYLAQNYRMNHELTIKDFEVWKKSYIYVKAVEREKKKASYLADLGKKNKVVRVLGKITSSVWLRQRIVRYRNAYLVRKDRKLATKG